jgi:hypothetical protein
MGFLAVVLRLMSATILSVTRGVAIRLFCKCVCCGRFSLVRWKFAGERYCQKCARAILADVYGAEPEPINQRVVGPSFTWDMTDEEIAAEIERFNQ